MTLEPFFFVDFDIPGFLCRGTEHDLSAWFHCVAESDDFFTDFVAVPVHPIHVVHKYGFGEGAGGQTAEDLFYSVGVETERFEGPGRFEGVDDGRFEVVWTAFWSIPTDETEEVKVIVAL